jgi:hypothetical protein
MHGGTIIVSDNKPQGTVFTVTLPMRNEGTTTTKQTVTKEKATENVAPSNTVLPFIVLTARAAEEHQVEG